MCRSVLGGGPGEEGEGGVAPAEEGTQEEAVAGPFAFLKNCMPRQGPGWDAI